MKRLYRKIIVLLFVIFQCFTSNAQILKDSLTNELDKIYKSSNITGLGVAIVNQEGILYSNSFGFANKNKQLPYTIQTQQPIASISKTILAVALMKAQEMGKLQINNPINQYLPFKIIHPYFPNEPITSKQLANHTSGISDGESYERTYVFTEKIPPFYKDFQDAELKTEIEKWVKFYNANHPVSLEDFIKKHYNKNQEWYDEKQNFSNTKPGTVYKYSNMNANIAAYILEKATGETYADFVRKYVLEPLDMNNSGWKGKNFEPNHLSEIYWYGQTMPYCDLITYPDGNFITNIIDYSKFLSAMLKAENGDVTFLSRKSYSEMTKNPASPDLKKGIFWSVDSEKTGHSGSDLGILTHSYFFKENGRGIIVFANSSGTDEDTMNIRNIYRTLLKYAKN